MLLKAAAWLAIAFGLFLAVAEVARNYPNWQWWPFWVVDYIAATLLVLGGVSVLRHGASAARWLTAGWGFATAMFYGSYFSHIGDAMEHAPDQREQTLTLIIGVMFVITILGLIASLIGGRAKS